MLHVRLSSKTHTHTYMYVHICVSVFFSGYFFCEFPKNNEPQISSDTQTLVSKEHKILFIKYTKLCETELHHEL